MQRSQLLLRQPFKALYLLYFYFVLLLVKLPFWILTSLPRSWRPRPSWTVFRTVFLQTMDAVMEAMVTTSTYTMLRVDPQKFAKSAETNGLVWVEPTPELIVGDIKEYATKNGVTPTRVAGYWYGDRSSPLPEEKIIYELHGGAFVFGDASPVSYLGNAGLCKEMLRHNQQFSKAFQIEYRLSQGPPLPYENPFPAALIDAVAGYHYLVKVMGYKPSEHPLNGGVGWWWSRHQLNWGSSHFGPESSVTTNRRSDFIGPFFGGYPIRAMLGALPPSEADTNAWLSPASKYLRKPSGWFNGFPPSFLIVGEAEMLRDSNRTLRERMAVDMGERLTYLEVPGATHIFLSFTWHEPERTEGFNKVAKWLSATM
ncbi:hypothetical protein NM688_g7011 [Phlebia brevispora]|uniref:Uncharacterized protein n=1 Tax=Phlebia brevispora TaxID=194682 RepID=A0ACC1S9Z1_9APHY|nr:hypothetical protein NM688_g7011 [Phlebia brevispora]